MGGCELDSSCAGYTQITDWCEHGNGNGMVRLHKMLVISRLSENSVPCSQLLSVIFTLFVVRFEVHAAVTVKIQCLL